MFRRDGTRNPQSIRFRYSVSLFGFGSPSQLLCHHFVLLRCLVVALGGVAVTLGSFAVVLSKSVDARVVGGFLVNFRGPPVYECGLVKTLGGAKTCLPSLLSHFVGCASCELGVIGRIVALPHGSRPYADGPHPARILSTAV